MRRTCILATPLAHLRLEAGERGLARVEFLPPDGDAPATPEAEIPPELREPAQAIRDYAAGDLTALQGLEVAPEGTGFQRDVWDALLRIPAGETRTYAEVAAMVGNRSAARAVGQAVGANPLPLVVPCHRVVPTGGGLGGYSAPQGTRLKRELLDHEGARVGLAASNP